jgi:hypothetical protein
MKKDEKQAYIIYAAAHAFLFITLVVLISIVIAIYP